MTWTLERLICNREGNEALWVSSVRSRRKNSKICDVLICYKEGNAAPWVSKTKVTKRFRSSISTCRGSIELSSHWLILRYSRPLHVEFETSGGACNQVTKRAHDALRVASARRSKPRAECRDGDSGGTRTQLTRQACIRRLACSFSVSSEASS